jgi:transposase
MATNKIRDDQWSRMVEFLRDCPGVYVGQEEKCRQFVEGVHWIGRTGAQWRELPEARFGKWNSVYKRYGRWADKGIWQRMHEHFALDADLEYLIPDSTVIRAHPCAAGAPEEKGGQGAQALGRSRGGFSTKIHAVVDSLGNPLRFLFTGGQRHDITRGADLIRGFSADYVIADRSYDSDAFITLVNGMGAVAVIPARKNRTQMREYDRHIYKERHLVECFFNKIKFYRRIFSRFDKLIGRFYGFLSLAATLLWLR